MQDSEKNTNTENDNYRDASESDAQPTTVLHREYDKETSLYADNTEGLAGKKELTLVNAERPYYQPTYYVGFMPFSWNERIHDGEEASKEGNKEKALLLLLPKGAPKSEESENAGELQFQSLVRFLDMWAIGTGLDEKEKAEKENETYTFARDLPLAYRFFFLIAWRYEKALRTLCHHDFRRFYTKHEETLNGRIKGRMHFPSMMRNALHGKAHRIPCRWEEFDFDNHDNRVLKAAMTALMHHAPDPALRRKLFGLFAHVLPYFSEVQDVSISPADLLKTKLNRISKQYKAAHEWASFIIRGMNAFEQGTMPQLTFNANDAFERFAFRITQKAAEAAGNAKAVKQPTHGLVTNQEKPQIDPDIRILPFGAGLDDTHIAVGDAKYKQVLELKDVDTSKDKDVIVFNEQSWKMKLRSADLYQLYAYIMLTGAKRGFFVVPFWGENMDAEATILHNQNGELKIGIKDMNYPIAVLMLNLMKPPRDVLHEAARKLRIWLQE